MLSRVQGIRHGQASQHTQHGELTSPLPNAIESAAAMKEQRHTSSAAASLQGVLDLMQERLTVSSVRQS